MAQGTVGEPEERLVKIVYREEMPGKRPRKRWKNNLIMT